MNKDARINNISDKRAAKWVGLVERKNRSKSIETKTRLDRPPERYK